RVHDFRLCGADRLSFMSDLPVAGRPDLHGFPCGLRAALWPFSAARRHCGSGHRRAGPTTQSVCARNPARRNIKRKQMAVSTKEGGTVLLTDYAWPDAEVERGIIESAGYRFVTGPSAPASEAEIDELVSEYKPDAIMTCWARVSARAIASTPNLKVVVRVGVGLDNIAVDTATQAGVLVTNVPDYCVDDVSDHA